MRRLLVTKTTSSPDLNLTVVSSAEVTKCPNCPWFKSHPQEPSCTLKEMSGLGGYDTMCTWHRIDANCPLLVPK